MGIRTKLNPMGGGNRKKPFTDVMKYTVQVSDNGYVNLPVSQSTYTPDTVIKIDWGDGSTQQLEQGVAVSKNRIHQYTNAGKYTISICTKSNVLYGLSFYSIPVREVNTPLIKTTWRSSSLGLFTGSGVSTIPQDLFKNNPQFTILSYCFMSCGIADIPVELTKYLPNLSRIDYFFAQNNISDITVAARFLQEVVTYNNVVSTLSCLFQSNPFTTQLTVEYANAFYNIRGNLNQLCSGWLINYIPYDIINSFTSNTSLTDAFEFCSLSGSLTLEPLSASVTNVTGMFRNCDFTEVYGTLGDHVVNLSSLFARCENLHTIHNDFIPSNVAIQSLDSIFYDCSLQVVPDTLLKGKNLTECSLSFIFIGGFIPKSSMFQGTSFSYKTDFSHMFDGYNGVMPLQLFDGCVVNNNDTLDLQYIVYDLSTELCEDLFSYFACWLDCDYALSYYRGTSIPESLFKNLKISSFNHGTAYSSLTQLPSKMFENCTFSSTMNFDYAFRETKLVTVPTDLFDGFNTEGITFTFNNCFNGLSTITSAVPELWNRTDMNITSHAACFRGCTNAANYADIPDDWK